MLLDNVVLRDCVATNSGGALYLEVRGGSILEIRNSQFLRNTAPAGGGLDLHIYDNSTVVIQDTLFQGNRASAGVGGAGRIVLHSGTVQIVGVTFEDNEASVSGGALAIVGAGVVDLYDSTLSSFNLTGTQFINNRALTAETRCFWLTATARSSTPCLRAMRPLTLVQPSSLSPPGS